MFEIQKLDHPTRASFGRKSDGILDCFRSGGMVPRNEFAAPRLGDFTSALLGSFNPVITPVRGQGDGGVVRRGAVDPNLLQGDSRRTESDLHL